MVSFLEWSIGLPHVSAFHVHRLESQRIKEGRRAMEQRKRKYCAETMSGTYEKAPKTGVSVPSPSISTDLRQTLKKFDRR